MSDIPGPERRHGYVQLDERVISLLRRVVREELDAAAKDGRLLSDTDKHDVRSWIQERKHQTEMREKIFGNTVGWLIIVIFTGLGLAVWEWIKHNLKSP